eukprot:TRINITY_DN433_c0_g1::TRINITY_DN433_c0_g1_i1::g.2467::m.2467 TRINITY_DN433_c0_g1::TRINITY_DN433_c0_g1_i1::g.2467  ORF type:complete len:456 (+),score=172.71,sp/Q9P4B6/LDHA_RHIOR/43.39/8e-74,Ldh_1_N/PF00056.18/2.4e-30,Ldh_1_C/PF02866.13/3e+03,Ldh_1_C/PF02866.13/9.3e-26,cNMP_binding/PF00027.24/9.5e-05,CoA_binding/PF02629.14/0.069,NAD_binding_8/PF13450.1/0.11,3HCDH_N/PF02737.13/0.19 TRINITY_DN433_c0_g1_i1:77-1369(+)
MVNVTEKIQALKAVKYLSALNDNTVRHVADALQFVAYNDGDLIAQGCDQGLFIIHSGIAVEQKPDSTVVEYPAGTYFGLGQLFHDVPHTGAFRARGAVQAWKLDACIFKNILENEIPATPAGVVIGVIGAGAVGASAASSLIQKNIAGTVKLFDINTTLCEGEVLDLQDEAFITGTTVKLAPTLGDLRDCDIVVITAGAKQQPGEPRTALVKRNAKILKGILEGMFPLRPSTILLLVTNPVDILTSLAQVWCAPYIPSTQVIGSGTYLDTQRLRVSLATTLGISVKSIHAYVLGEHGDSQFVSRSASRIGGCSLDQLSQLNDEDLKKLEEATKRKAYEIINRKGATSHGIGACVAAICESIVLDKREVLPVSAKKQDGGCCMGWPSILGKKGIIATMPLQLTPHETEALNKTTEVMTGIIREVLADPTLA